MGNSKFTWSGLRDGPRRDPRPINHTPDAAAGARRRARDAAESYLLAVLQPWREAAFARCKDRPGGRAASTGAELFWQETIVRPKVKQVEARAASCRTSQERLKLAEEILEELRRSDRGFVRGGGATMAVVLDLSHTVREFLVDQLIIINNDTNASPAG
jgi:hypothetical protein